MKLTVTSLNKTLDKIMNKILDKTIDKTLGIFYDEIPRSRKHIY